MTLDQIRYKLRDRNLAFIAREIGVTKSWLNAIRRGDVKRISNDLEQKLITYLEAS